ncbi:MAG: formate dehydrogenase subunit alpha [Gemmatimonadetes bacterium]|nr:formate dehydrogenase subunit alpha [Gemmatimonadota bacterium]MYG86270.1 formate dehydrogenase subunit alpha [Gemmatimonadota bacterium]MYJ90230.1 formate dehydrogenase subunit alpha [Gemmatimonadota bacterium]
MNNRTVTLTIDGRSLTASAGATIWEAARSAGIDIPTLCHDPKLEPVAVCRVCVVDVENARILPAACIRQVEEGMAVRTDTDRVRRARRTLVELMEAGQPHAEVRRKPAEQDELARLGVQLRSDPSRFAAASSNAATCANPPIRPDLSSPVIAVELNACILCDRCIRACDDVQVNDVIGRAGKGCDTRIAFDNGLPLGGSSCVSCGECVATCPTGALTDKRLVDSVANGSDSVAIDSDAAANGSDTLGTDPDAASKNPEETEQNSRRVDSICPYCGVGCGISYHVRNGRIEGVTGRDDTHTEGRLCVKGRYGYDYTHHPQRLTRPLVRREDAYPKEPLSADFKDYRDFRRSLRSPEWNDRIREVFREAEWDEALDLAARRLLEIKNSLGPGALAGFGSAKVTNEEAFLFQKLIRVVFGTNNVDHCTRLCHASSVAALTEAIGSGAVSNAFQEVLETDVIFVIGSNTEDNHPVAASYMKQAVARGVRMIVLDPRRPTIADHATRYVRFKPGTDIALLNGLMHVILREGLQDRDFIARRTERFEALEPFLARYTPEMASRITGVPPTVIEEIALEYGRAERAMIFWGMGISQHVNGTDNARALISLCLMTGNIGRRGTGLHPLRGQNNVQGASDVGLIPRFYPGYQSADDPQVRKRFEEAWDTALDPDSGLTVVEIMHGALDGSIAGMLMMGENPFLSDPNMNKVRKALQRLSFLVVQDVFLTETAEFADVILPASTAAEKRGTYVNTNRMVQIGRQAIDPPGEARLDGDILIDLANRMIRMEQGGSGPRWAYDGPESVWEEIVALTPIFNGITYEAMERETVVWPLEEPVLFTGAFPRGRGRFTPVSFAPPDELPDDAYPFVLNTGRVLEHWHTGTMTRRARALDAISPEPFVEMTPGDLERLGVEEGDPVSVSSRRGAITLKAKASGRVADGNVFIPFHFKEAAANILTNDALDPDGKIPEFKFCAVAVKPVPSSD